MIGLLYESGEWSDYKLAAELSQEGCAVRMVDMAHLNAEEVLSAIKPCSMLVSRVFASALFRNHARAHANMELVCAGADKMGIAMVNKARAHSFEIDKRHATSVLADGGIDVPRVQAYGFPSELSVWFAAGCAHYPCIIKPNCGGRTTYTSVAHTPDEALSFLKSIAPIELIVEDYLKAEHGFITRIELIEGACVLAVKRSVVEGGLSAYRLGSTYELYDDCPRDTTEAARKAGELLDIAYGSFDIIEREGKAYVIDANSVSNVSPDNTEMFGLDLMKEYAVALASRLRSLTD